MICQSANDYRQWSLKLGMTLLVSTAVNMAVYHGV